MSPKNIMQVRVRMPRDLHKRVQREADRHGQTINAEILVRLERSFEIKQTLDRIEEMVRSMLPTAIYAPRESRQQANISTVTSSNVARVTAGDKSDD
jgi:predicted ribosome quality control (RQC) complex YloA/Tae2 family protein